LVRQWSADHPEFAFLPRKITWLDELPKPGVGKILRRELRDI